jgi:hypothetical protein
MCDVGCRGSSDLGVLVVWFTSSSLKDAHPTPPALRALPSLRYLATISGRKRKKSSMSSTPFGSCSKVSAAFLLSRKRLQTHAACSSIPLMQGF